MKWCQLEFFPKSQLKTIQSKLIEYKSFEQNHRVSSGWKNVYIRNIQREEFVLTVENITSLEDSALHPAPLLTTASSPLGQVKNGFSVSIGEGALLYGITEGGVVKSLAASVYSDTGNNSLTNAYVSLDKKEKLIIVDWRSQMIIMGSSADGKLEVWKP